MTELPIVQRLPRIREALAGALVLQSPPGTGKTTCVPPLVAGAVQGRVIVTQPRRVAVRASARRIASVMGGAVGERVGYTVRGESRISASTRIEVVTPGVLVRRMQADPELPGVGAIVLDEVHERHLESDLTLAFAADIRALRSDLTLVAMSATMSGDIADFLGASVVDVPGVTHPVEIRYAPPQRGVASLDARGVPADFLAHVAAVTRRAVEEGEGDVLVFLPGVGEINRVAGYLASDRVGESADVVILHGGISPKAQDVVMTEGPRRRIILSTAVAESSLTVPGVRCVVDAGLSREPRMDYGRAVGGLVTRRVSRAAATQRAGRAGRLGPGLVFRCFDEATMARLVEYPEPAVRTADLTDFALQVACWGSVELLEEPSEAGWAHAHRVLEGLGLMAGERPTDEGRTIARMPVDPRIGAALLTVPGPRATVSHAAALLASDLRVDDADLVRSWDRVPQADVRRLARFVPAETGSAVRREGPTENGGGPDIQSGVGAASAAARERVLARVVTAAFPERVARRREGGGRYLTAGGLGAVLPPGSPLEGQEWLAIAALDLNGRADAVIRAAVVIDNPEDLPRSTRHEVELAGDRLRGITVEGVGAIDLVRKPAPLDAGAAREWLSSYEWEVSEPAAALLERLAFLRSVHGEPWPDVDDALVTWRDVLVGPEEEACARGARIRPIGVDQVTRIFPWPEAVAIDELAPERVSLPLGTAAVDYSTGRPRVSVRIQEVFGLAETPRISGIPVTLELLSPARRPLAVTDDLASFWAGPYAGVRADMRGRYPKHPWPEDPASAEPTRRTKRRG